MPPSLSWIRVSISQNLSPSLPDLHVHPFPGSTPPSPGSLESVPLYPGSVPLYPSNGSSLLGLSPSIPLMDPLSWVCPPLFLGLSPSIPGTVPLYSWDCPPLFLGLSPSIPLMDPLSWVCPPLFLGLSPSIPLMDPLAWVCPPLSLSWILSSWLLTKYLGLVGWMKFNVSFRHWYGHIGDKQKPEAGRIPYSFWHTERGLLGARNHRQFCT